MAVKASAHITLNSVVDIEATYRYYILQSSTASAPAKPTTFPPSSSWSDAEPTYDSGSTNSLYYVDCTVFSDGSFGYSEVSLSTSYEAAKEAYNKAQNAQDAVDNLDVGGRNLLLNSSFNLNADEWTVLNSEMTTIDEIVCGHITGALETSGYVAQDITDKIDWDNLDQTYVFSADMRLDNYVKGTTNPYLGLHMSGQYDDNGTTAYLGVVTVDGSPYIAPYAEMGWVRITWTLKFDRALDILRAHVYTRDFTGDLYFKNLKLEKGNVATDWTPAPEDIDASIDNVNTEIRQEITEQNISITQNCEGIIMEALTAYTKTSDFDAFHETVTAQLALLSDQISFKFTEQQQQITDMNESLQGQLNTITKYFTFSINGLTIGQQDNPYKVIIDNDRYSMTVNDVEVMWIANGKVYTPEIEVTNSFRLLDYLISQDSAGNVNCEYIGG